VKVLYVSKALVVAAYRDKLRELAAHVDVAALVPERWGEQTPEPDPDAASAPPILTRPALLHGHNHFHVYRGAGAVLDAVRPDLVHIDEEPYSIVTLQFAELCRARGIPSLFFAWQNLAKRLPPPFGALRARVFRLVAGGIAGTAAAARVLRDAGYRGPLAVIPQFGVNPVRFAPDARARADVRARLGIGEGAFLVGFGGRLVPEKGVHLLLEALASLAGDAHLLVMGDGPERPRLEAQAAQGGIAERVHFVGAVPSVAMPRWLAALDVLALPSLRKKGWAEQFGRILVEAMACGVPVVGSATGEVPEVVGEGGVVVPEADAAALAAALRGFATMAPDALAEARLRARAWVCSRYTQERVARETVEFYRQLMNEQSGGAASRRRVAVG